MSIIASGARLTFMPERGEPLGQLLASRVEGDGRTARPPVIPQGPHASG